jgi:hypothetical protein
MRESILRVYPQKFETEKLNFVILEGKKWSLIF